MKRPRSLTPGPSGAGLALAALLLSAVALAGDGTLPAADWKKLEADAARALEAGEVEAVRAALDSAAKDRSVRALKLVEKVAAGTLDAALSACGRAAAALAADSKDVAKEARKDALAVKSPRVKTVLVAALRPADPENVPVLVKLAADPAEDVAVAAIRSLAEGKADAAVDPLVAQMEKLDAARGPIWEELRYALGDLLGGRLASGAEYRARWAALKAKGGTKAVGTPEDPKPREPTPTAGGSPRTVELFGREVLCSRVVFILDVSGSMTKVDDPALELPPETRGKGTSAAPGAPPAPAGAVDPRSRIERAKRELKKVLKGLPRGSKVNLIAFSTGVRLWRAGTPPALHALDAATVSDATKWVDELSADGTTATDEALDKAFEVDGARCFYLLSDGEPTKDGTTRIPTDTILALIASKNATKRIRIHTLGFPGADPEFMKAVSAATGGEYSDIK